MPRRLLRGIKRRRNLRIERIDISPIVPADLGNILEPGGCDQRTTRQLALQHGIGRNRRAVQQVPYVRQREAIARRCRFDTGQ